MTCLRRRLASITCALIQKALPTDFRTWGEAIRVEVSEIENDTTALIFALDSLLGLVWRFLAFHLLRLSSAIAGTESLLSAGPSTMTYLDEWQATPRTVGAVCAIGATLLGFAFMIMGSAPMGYLGINLGALVIGLLLFANLTNSRYFSDHWRSPMLMAAGLSLVVTALFGLNAGGLTRWIKLGPLIVQPSMVFIPMMIVAFVRLHSLTATLGMFAAAFALAIQPDRAMAAALAAGMIALLASRRDTMAISATIASIAGFSVTMLRPDATPAMPFVDQVVFRSFDIHVLAGSAVIGGLALLVLPAFTGSRFGFETRAASLVFGVTWAAVIIASALGNYPTPLVGYGGSAVLGYLLSLATLPKATAAPETLCARSIRNDAGKVHSDTSFKLGAA